VVEQELHQAEAEQAERQTPEAVEEGQIHWALALEAQVL